MAATLKRGQLIILESTTYPGTTDEVVQPMLEAQGLKADEDFFLAFSPERVDPGQPEVHTHATSRRSSAASAPASTEAAAALYGATVDTVVPVSSTRVAEMVKLLENTFRAVNIGLVNEIALMCHKMDIDVWEVIDAAKTKPFGFMPFYPGPGLGGHCIPIDPFYLSWKARQHGFECRFIELAGARQLARCRDYVVERVAEALNTSKKADQRLARPRARRRLQARRQRHARVAGARHHRAAGASAAPTSATPIRACRSCAHDGAHAEVDRSRESAVAARPDCAVICTDHAAFNYDALVKSGVVIVDTRNALKDRQAAEHLPSLMHTWLLDLLVCPECRGALEPDGGRREKVARSSTGTLTARRPPFPITDGVPRFVSTN